MLEDLEELEQVSVYNLDELIAEDTSDEDCDDDSTEFILENDDDVTVCQNDRVPDNKGKKTLQFESRYLHPEIISFVLVTLMSLQV